MVLSSLVRRVKGQSFWETRGQMYKWGVHTKNIFTDATQSVKLQFAVLLLDRFNEWCVRSSAMLTFTAWNRIRHKCGFINLTKKKIHLHISVFVRTNSFSLPQGVMTLNWGSGLGKSKPIRESHYLMHPVTLWQEYVFRLFDIVVVGGDNILCWLSYTHWPSTPWLRNILILGSTLRWHV